MLKSFFCFLTFLISGLLHPHWASLTVFWIFAPFVFHLVLIMLQPEYREDWRKGIKKAFQHLPMVIPVTNLYHAYQLYKVV